LVLLRPRRIDLVLLHPRRMDLVLLHPRRINDSGNKKNNDAVAAQHSLA
jgi:hypothetical protein